jgi:hypothetical protein
MPRAVYCCGRLQKTWSCVLSTVTTKTQARGVSRKRARDVRRRRIATKAFSIQEDKATGGRLPAT